MALHHLIGFGTRERRRGLPFALLAAMSVHGALALTLRARPAVAAEVPTTTELELAEPPKPEPEPAPPVDEPKPEPIAAQAKAVAAPAARAPAAAKAGALLTANEDDKPARSDEPVSFVTDPNGTSYGSGVVAKGGTADVGADGAKPKGVAAGTGVAATMPKPTAKAGDAIVPASDLGRPPSLADADACKGYFPGAADGDAATVSLMVVVKRSGEVASAGIVAEAPKGEGFGQAARACLLARRFSPGLDKSGNAVTTSTKVTVHFSR